MINQLAGAFAKRVPLPDILRIDTPYSPLIGSDPTRGAMALLPAKFNKA